MNGGLMSEKNNERKVKLFLKNIKIPIFLMISKVKCIFFIKVYAVFGDEMSRHGNMLY